MEPLWRRDDLPIKGAGFRDARGMGFAACIGGNNIPQEVHFLQFRDDTAKCLFTLLLPAKSHDEDLYNRTTEELGMMMRTMTLR